MLLRVQRYRHIVPREITARVSAEPNALGDVVGFPRADESIVKRMRETAI